MLPVSAHAVCAIPYPSKSGALPCAGQCSVSALRRLPLCSLPPFGNRPCARCKQGASKTYWQVLQLPSPSVANTAKSGKLAPLGCTCGRNQAVSERDDNGLSNARSNFHPSLRAPGHCRALMFNCVRPLPAPSGSPRRSRAPAAPAASESRQRTALRALGVCAVRGCCELGLEAEVGRRECKCHWSRNCCYHQMLISQCMLIAAACQQAHCAEHQATATWLVLCSAGATSPTRAGNCHRGPTAALWARCWSSPRSPSHLLS